MATIINWLRLLRPLNLLLFFCGQLLAFNHLLWRGYEPDSLVFVILALCTFALGAFSNVYNDLIDLPADLINKPDKVFFTPASKPIVVWYILFWLFLAVILSIIYFMMTDDWIVLFILVIQIPLSVWYSARLKKTPLWGNLLIGLQCLLVIGIIYLNEFTSLHTPYRLRTEVHLLLAFVFFATLSRELTKDITDMPGDRVVGALTTPIAWGYLRANMLNKTYLYLLVTLTTILALFYQTYAVITFLTVGLFFMECYLLYLAENLNFKRLSTALKAFIALGILYFALVFYLS